jgi:hypothetical protein
MKMIESRVSSPYAPQNKKKGTEENNIWKEFMSKTSSVNIPSAEPIRKIINEVDCDGILNTKELQSFSHITASELLPKDVFNSICDSIIAELINPSRLNFTEFRDLIYDILVYNLEITDCIWYILSYLVENKYLEEVNILECIEKIHVFLKQYNNNYRPIYHLESIFYYFISKIHKYK